MEADNDHDDDDLELDSESSAFAVRMSDDHQVVGIFVAEDLEQLAELVDQCCDPASTDYLKLGIGGVYVSARTAAQWPARMEKNGAGEDVDVVLDDADPLKGAGLDDFWWRDVDDGEWLPLIWKRSLAKAAPPRRRPPRRR